MSGFSRPSVKPPKFKEETMEKKKTHDVHITMVTGETAEVVIFTGYGTCYESEVIKELFSRDTVRSSLNKHYAVRHIVSAYLMNRGDYR
jgi:hypothetical protein